MPANGAGPLNQRVEIFAYSNIGGMFPESRYTRVQSAAQDGAWWANVEAASTAERQIAAQSQSEVHYSFTFRQGVPSLTSDAALRWPAGVGHPLYKIVGEPLLERKFTRITVNAVKVGDEVSANVVE